MQKLNDFEILSKLGEGSYSQVYKVLRKSDNIIYAMKKVKLFELKEKERENALNEVRILASYNDTYIISFKVYQIYTKDAFIEENMLCIVMEYATDGDLQQRIKDAQKTGMLPEREIWKALYQISKGLKRLHEMKIVHRDLKSANIFISGGTYKLGDLNVSKVTKRGLAYTQTGTPYYASPEVWRNEAYNQQSDIWSLGTVIYEMATLKLPFKGNDLTQLCARVQRGLFEQLPKCYSRDLQSIITQMLQVQPIKRISANQILQSPFMQKYYHEVDTQSQGQNQLLQTIHLNKNLKQLELPKSNYNSQRAKSALPQQAPQTLSPLNKAEDYSKYPSAPRKKQDPTKSPVSQPTRVQSAVSSRQQQMQEQLRLELIREREKLQRQQTNHQQEPKAQNRNSQNTISTSQSARKLETQPESLRQQIIQQHKLEEQKQILSAQRQTSVERLNPIEKKERTIVSAQPQVQPKQQQPVKVEIQQQQEIVKKVDNPQTGSEDELFVSGLQNINPKSIQSILCQPVLSINDNPFPTRAKVSRVQSAKQGNPKNETGLQSHKHYFPIEDEFNDQILKKPIK